MKLPEVDRVLLTSEAIAARVREMGETLARDLARDLTAEGHGALDHPDRIVMVPIMTGAMVFAADLIRTMPIRISIRTVVVSSYPGASTTSKGAALRGALPDDLRGRHVVLVDDILDSGQTLGMLSRMIREQEPASVRVCVLLRKDVTRVEDIAADLVGFDIPDEFVVGYGLDYNGFYRNVPDIVALRGEHLDEPTAG